MTTTASTTAMNKKSSDFITFLAFMLMGAGANWIAIAAISQQTSYFINSSPQGLCVGSFMNLSNNAGFLMVVAYFFITRRIAPISHVISAPIVFLTGAGSVFLAIGYEIEINNISILLYLSCFFAGAVGAVGAVILPQFLAGFQDDLITAGCAGGNFGIVISAIVGIIQSPGGADRFSASIYLMIFGILLITPLFPFYWIVTNKIGLRDSPPLTKEDVEIEETTTSNPISSNHQPTVFEVETRPSEGNDRQSEKATNRDSINLLIDQLEINDPIALPPMHNSQLMLLSSHYIAANRLTFVANDDNRLSSSLPERIAEKILLLIFKNISKEDLQWMKKALPYALALGLCDFCVFGIGNSSAPFSFNNIAGTSSGVFLSISIEVGSILLFIGDITTSWFRLPMWFTLPIMFIITLIDILTAFNIIYLSPYALVVFCGMNSFIEAHILTTVYRCVATEFPQSCNQKVARLIGFTDGFLNTLGAILSFLVVISLAPC